MFINLNPLYSHYCRVQQNTRSFRSALHLSGLSCRQRSVALCCWLIFRICLCLRLWCEYQVSSHPSTKCLTYGRIPFIVALEQGLWSKRRIFRKQYIATTTNLEIYADIWQQLTHVHIYVWIKSPTITAFKTVLTANKIAQSLWVF